MYAATDLNGVDTELTTLEGDYTNSSTTPAVLTLTNSSEVDYSGTISGNISVQLKGTGAVRIRNEQTFTGPLTINYGATVYAYVDDALGNGVVTNKSKGTIYFVKGSKQTFSNNFVVNQDNSNDKAFFRFNNDVTFNGRFDMLGTAKGGAQMNIDTKRIITFNGPVTMTTAKPDYWIFNSSNGGSEVWFNDTVDLGMPGSMLYSQNQTIYIHVKKPFYTGSFHANTASTGFICEGENVFAENFDPAVDKECNFDVNGFNQTIPFFAAANSKVVTLTNSAETVATLTLTPTTDRTAQYNVCGALNLTCAAAAGKTITLQGSKWNSTGTLRVASGNLALNTTDIFSETLELVVEEGATLTLNEELALQPAHATIGGEKLAIGKTYKASDLAGLEGTGTICCVGVIGDETEAVWNAGENKSTTTLANWEDATALPDMSFGTTHVIVKGGEEMALTDDVRFNGFSFMEGALPFAITGTDKQLDIGLNGITIPDQTEAAALTITANASIANDEEWNIGANATVTLSAPITGAGSLIKSGVGTLALNNGFAANSNISVTNGILEITGAETSAHPELYTLGFSTFTLGDGDTRVRSYINLHNATITRAMAMATVGTGRNAASGPAEIMAKEGENFIKGHITRTGGESHNLAGGNTILGAETGAKLIIDGGFTGNWILTNSDGGDVIFTNNTITANGFEIYASSSGNVYFYTQGNAVKEVGFGSSHQQTVHLMVSDVFNDNTAIFLNCANANAILDFHGNDQHFGSMSHHNTRGCKMRTDAPMTLTINQTTHATNMIIMAGAINLVKQGASNLLLNGAQNDFAGTLTVNEGTLGFAANSSWANLANLEQATGTRIILENTSPVVTGYYTRDGKIMAAGTYGSSASTAKFKDDTRFSGTGVLRVRHDNLGTCIILR